MNRFPPLYHHAHHASYSDDLTFYLELARHYGQPIVELGCGTGRVLHVLQNAGHDIVGLDNEIEMLRFLRRRGAARVFCAEMTSLALAPVFRLALLPCNTYSTFASPQRLALLDRVWRCLQIGGAFAVSFPNPALLQSLPPKVDAELEEIVLHPETTNPVQIFTSWQRNQEWLSVTWTYDHLFADGEVERVQYRQTYSLQAVDRFFIEIEQSGFLVRATYGSFDKKPLQRFSPNVIILAEKTARDGTQERSPPAFVGQPLRRNNDAVSSAWKASPASQGACRCTAQVTVICKMTVTLQGGWPMGPLAMTDRDKEGRYLHQI